MATGKLRTGDFEHQVTLGASWQKQVNYYSSNAVYQLVGTGSIFGQNTNSYNSVTNLTPYRNSDITQRATIRRATR